MIKTSVTLAYQKDSGVSPFRAAEFEEGLDWACGLGVDAVELSVAWPGAADTARMRESLERRNMPVSTLSTGVMAGEGLVFCDEDAAVRGNAVRHIREHIDLASALAGKPAVTIGLARGMGGGDAETLARQRAMIAECLERCCEYASKKGIMLNLEPFNRYESAHLHTARECAVFIRALRHSDSVGILYDTFHSNIEDANMTDTIEEFSRMFSHVHFADSNRGLPGEGHIDFAGVLQALQKTGYDRYISLEVLNVPDRGHVRGFAHRFVSLVRAALSDLEQTP
ncbi:MAG: sugar phosphate isomerase/epimerase [Synergistaceae bacterium]|jgi:sugar phosphate isomerase/epimerase|nr:sugar phosphate isomerase/epimerase [Synergistaceae bacterium]